MNELIETVKEDARSWWKELLTRKPLMDRTIEELEKKRKQSKNLILSFLATALFIWFFVLDLFLEGKASITLSTLFIVLFIAAFCEMIQNYQIQLFIYIKRHHKKKELEKMEKFP